MLNLSKIKKVYPSGNVTALHEVSLAFRPNEFVSILGPSGCGKTTLLLSLIHISNAPALSSP